MARFKHQWMPLIEAEEGYTRKVKCKNCGAVFEYTWDATKPPNTECRQRDEKRRGKAKRQQF